MSFAEKKQRHELIPGTDDVMRRTHQVWEELQGHRVFLTGGTGFFGCWLLELFTYAYDQGFSHMNVTVLSRNPEAFQSRAPHLASHPSVTVLKGDVRSFAFPSEMCSHIIHGATDPSVALNKEDPDLMYHTIVEGTKRVLEFSHGCRAEKMLLISSGAVYGAQPSSTTHMPEDEDILVTAPQNPSAYAEGKREAERLWKAIDGSSSHTIARCYAFVGPYMHFDSFYAIGNFIRDAVAGKPIVVQGDGTPRRSYLYASDLAEWLWTILCRGENGRAYNVGSERDVSVVELASLVAKNVSSSLPVRVLQAPVPEMAAERYVPATLRANAELGLQEHIPLEEAIQRTAAWYAQRHSTSR